MKGIGSYLEKQTSAAPLAVFRMGLGLMLFVSMIRFWAKGWIAELYIQPKYFFKYYGFEFIRSWGGYTYLLFAICAIAALFVAIGLFYRISSVALFLSFTYIELIDKTTYLNHYYFVSLVSFLMMFLPAHAYFSADAWRNSNVSAARVPQWCIDSLKLLVCMLYIFAGLAKVNSDWLLHAQPLKIWLPAKNDLPLIGSILNYTWIAYLFAWVGCIYDLFIPFFLLKSFTRPFAFVAVIVFHVLTSVLFPIGMFPYVMIFTATIFFSAHFHERILDKLKAWLRITYNDVNRTYMYDQKIRAVVMAVFIVFFTIQALIPFRYAFYPDELFWTEEGYRFSWRVMLMEKAGSAQFMVRDSSSGAQVMVDNKEFLTPLQEKMMATQPDMILQYAHILRDHFAAGGFKQPEVYVDSYVALNGRLGKPLVDSKTDLAKLDDSFQHKNWILPFEHDIQGF